MHVPGGELAQDVIEQLQVLSKRGGFKIARAERRRELQATSDGGLRTRRRLKELGGDLDTAVAGLQLSGQSTRMPIGFA